MNKDTKELQHRLNKDYLTIDDVKQQTARNCQIFCVNRSFS